MHPNSPYYESEILNECEEKMR